MKTRIQKLISILMVMALLSGLLAMTALADAASDFQVSNGVLTSYLGSAAEVKIPNNLGISAIGDQAFQGKQVVAVSIPSGVISIGVDAFSSCVYLTSVSIPDSVNSIGESAFHGCLALTSITIPKNLTSIDRFVFAYTGLTSVVIPSNITSIDWGAFCYCSVLKSITIPSSVKTIEEWAFYQDPALTIYGRSGSYAQSYASKNTISFSASVPPVTPIVTPSGITAAPTTSPVFVNGTSVAFQAYTIYGNNYFKLRDLATVLSGSGKQFNVGWDGVNNAISITSNMPYTTVGGELVNSGDSSTVAATLSSAKVYLDGMVINLTAYTINGNNYFKLRDLGQALNFGVIWDASVSTIRIDTSTGYTA